MTTLTYDKIMSSTLLLLEWEQLLVVAAALERLCPVYITFSSECNWGDPTIITDSLDFIWECASHSRVDDIERSLRLSMLCDANAPDLDDFSHRLGSPSLDVAISLSTVLQKLGTGERFSASESLPMTFESIYMLAACRCSQEDRRSDDLVYSDPSCQREFQQILESCYFAKSTRSMDAAERRLKINLFRDECRAIGAIELTRRWGNRCWEES